jgi:hypothetical protein
MEIRSTATLIELINSRRSKILKIDIHLRRPATENRHLRRCFRRTHCEQLIGDIIAKPAVSRFVILCRATSREKERIHSIEVNITPLKLLKLATPQARRQREQISQATRTSDTQQRAHLLIRQCTPARVLSRAWQRIDDAKWVHDQPTAPDHPGQQARRFHKVVIKRLRIELLFRPPRHERIGRHIPRKHPLTFGNQPLKVPAEAKYVLGSATRKTFRNELRKVNGHRLTGSITERLGGTNAGKLKLFFSAELD